MYSKCHSKWLRDPNTLYIFWEAPAPCNELIFRVSYHLNAYVSLITHFWIFVFHRIRGYKLIGAFEPSNQNSMWKRGVLVRDSMETPGFQCDQSVKSGKSAVSTGRQSLASLEK